MQQFAAIRCPTLVVHSELDPIPSAWSLALANKIPDAEFALIDGAGHFPMIENPDDLRTTVTPFLRKHTA